MGIVLSNPEEMHLFSSMFPLTSPILMMARLALVYRLAFGNIYFDIDYFRYLRSVVCWKNI